MEAWDREQALQCIRQAHVIAVADAPGIAPELDEDAGFWAVSVLFWGSSLFIDRAVVETQLPNSLVAREPRGDRADQHWSVDLGLRFLASLIQRSERIAKGDPLGTTLSKIATRWPLAAVGSEVVIDDSRLEVIIGDDCLRRLMVDRVIQRKDKRFQQHPLLRDEVLRAVGANVQWLTSE